MIQVAASGDAGPGDHPRIRAILPEGTRVVFAESHNIDWRVRREWHATYVLYHKIRDYLACGWMVVIPNAPMHHHQYSVLMEWRCDCNMPRP